MNYDKLYRLSSVKASNNALIEGFTYDATGNRLSKQLGATAPVNYSYAATDHKLSNSGAGARSFDANGNSTLIPGTGTLSYDERNRLMGTSLKVGVKPNQYYVGVSSSYNAHGERVMCSRFGLGATQLVPVLFDEADKLLATGDAKSADEIVYLDSIPVARVKAGAINPIEADHLGSPRVLQDAAGSSAVWNWNLLSNSASGSNAFGEQVPSSTVTEFNLRFPGQYSDSNGLSYNYFRDYEAGTGRYVESDPIGLKGGISTFEYAKSNPSRFSDSAGLAPSENYCRAHPINCSGAYLCGGIALSIAGGGNDDYSDAMRHCIWSCCMAANIGQSGAKDVGDDNEKVPNNPENSKNMDYCNNQTGRDCGKKPMGAYSYILGCTVCCAGSPLKTL